MRDRTTTPDTGPARRDGSARTTGPTALLATVVALLFGTLMTGSLAAATPALASSAESSDSESDAALQPVVVVMDYSSSMLEADADDDGTTRLKAAQQATTNLLDNAPDGADLGLVVYGSQKPDDCKDITTVQKVGPTNAGELKTKINGLEAVGETPIGASLLHAADELEGMDGEKSIILVSDGEENCSEPPACEAAQSLADQGIGLTVHTIGFKVNDTAAEELTCVAEATGGTYVQADDAEELSSRLETKTVRAFEGYVPQGTEITGGEALHSSPEMAPGQYLDEYERGGSSRWAEDGTLKFYNLGTIQPGERAHFSALLVPNPESDDGAAGIAVQLVNGQGETCSSSTGNASEPASEGGKPIVAYVRSKDYTDQSGCYADGSGQLYAKVLRTGDRQNDQPLPVELKYVLEPAVDENDLVAPAKEQLEPQAVDLSDEPEAVAGGGSFNDAAELDPETVLTDSVMPQEARYYRVHVGYGQRLNVRASQGNAENAGPNGIRVGVFSSVRGPVRMMGDATLYRSDTGDTVTQSMRVPVSQSNRDGSVGNDAYLSGDYYVVVSADKWSSDRNRDPYNYDLGIQVTGEEVDGPAITDASAEASPEQSAEPSPGSSGPETPANDGGADAGAADGSSDDQGTTDGQATALGATERTSAPLPWFAGGLVASLILGGLLIALLRRQGGTEPNVAAGYQPVPDGGGYPTYPPHAPTQPPHQNGYDQNGPAR
ncbi:VWA domain-containing protein [Citricoccus sp. GCM10030269]|uniref:vWA domain-containing protein n=1 Tax=Citricoccus sp. GCM10030269 TaxID=3273388 RepID=UPI003618BC7D